MTDNPFEPFETTPELDKAEERRINAAEAQIKDADVELVKEVLTRLPLRDSERHLVGQAARKICFALEARPGRRSPKNRNCYLNGERKQGQMPASPWQPPLQR